MYGANHTNPYSQALLRQTTILLYGKLAGHVMDHDYYLDVSKEDPYFNNENKVVDKLLIPSDGNAESYILKKFVA